MKPCTTHPPSPPWAGSKQRRRELGATLTAHQEEKRRRKILRIYGAICHVCHQPFAEQVDHVIPLAEGGPDTEDNLRPIHEIPCHQRKTAAEAARGRRRRGGRG